MSSDAPTMPQLFSITGRCHATTRACLSQAMKRRSRIWTAKTARISTAGGSNQRPRLVRETKFGLDAFARVCEERKPRDRPEPIPRSEDGQRGNKKKVRTP